MTGRADTVARTGRWRRGTGLLCASVLLAACSSPLDRGTGADDIPPGCGECTDEIADLVATLEGTSGVEAVTSARRTRGVSAAHVSIGLDLTGEDVVATDVGAVVDAVAEAAWSSEVSPLDVLTLDVTLRNGYTEGNGLFFGRDRETYEQRWGKRPPGTEWTPLDAEDAEQEEDDAGDSDVGCEHDGCHELMREVARTVTDLPGVSAVTLSRFLFDDVTDADLVQVHVRPRGAAADPEDLAGAVGEVVWRSEVDPLDYIEVQVETAGFPETTTFHVSPDTGRDRDRLERRWGPRPVG